MLKFIFKFIIKTVLILAIIAVGLLTYLGVMPWSSSFGVGQKDLGIKVTKEESAAAIGKVGTQIIALPAVTPNENSFRLEGTKIANFIMDSQEISAHSNNRPWRNYPIKNVQIKIHDDGTIESSAILIVSKAMPYAMGLGYSRDQIKEEKKKYNIPPVEVPIYILGKGSVSNDKVTVDATNVKIGNIAIPSNILSQINTEAKNVLEDLIRRNGRSFHCESLTFANCKLDFKGRVAEKLYVATE